MTLLELKNVSKGFGRGAGRTSVIADVSLAVKTGEIVAIVGYSGSGKTTLINLMAGLHQPDSGEVLLRGKPAGAPGPDRGVVFQNYSLLPWLSVMDNVKLAVGMALRDRDAAEIDAQCRKYIDRVGLSHAITKKPSELSGGMRQRVSLARSLAMQPSLLLLDEPLGALDALTRAGLQEELARISQVEQTTMVLVTNDVDEAILLADRIVPLSAGPDATLGPSFEVDIPRPRERRSTAAHPNHPRLKRRVIDWLVASKQAKAERGAA
ncbi:MAG: ABC transporter ATP-binding protein [Tepidisphaeraceae bacterium]